MTKEIEFESEYILHKLTQNHLKDLFDLEFVASEIQLNSLRLDNLAFDVKTKSFVIIEYKNEFNANVLNQAQSYYDLILDNPDYFLNRLDDRENVDFEKTRIMIIGPQFSNTQVKNAKSNFELLKTTLFDDGRLTYENLKTGEIKTLYVDLNELKLTQEKLLEDKSEEMKNLYLNLKNAVLNEFDDIEIRFLVDAFSFKTNNSLICLITFLKSSFNIFIYGDNLKNRDKLKDISMIKTGGKANYQLKYTSDDDLDYFMDIFKQTYNQKRQLK